jgi:hypothetical protein
MNYDSNAIEMLSGKIEMSGHIYTMIGVTKPSKRSVKAAVGRASG